MDKGEYSCFIVILHTSGKKFVKSTEKCGQNGLLKFQRVIEDRISNNDFLDIGSIQDQFCADFYLPQHEKNFDKLERVVVIEGKRVFSYSMIDSIPT